MLGQPSHPRNLAQRIFSEQALTPVYPLKKEPKAAHNKVEMDSK